MGICSGCGLDFVFLGTDTCLKCKKRRAAPSAIEQEAIEKQPQCEKCSVIYPFMKSTVCGTCERRCDGPSVAKNIGEAAWAASDAAAQNLLNQSRDTQKTASAFRMNQVVRTQNPALQAAAAKKENLAALRKMSRADTLSVEASLYFFPLAGSAAKKAQLLHNQQRWPSATSTAQVLDASKSTMESNFNNSPPTLRGDTCAMNFEDVTYGIAKGTSVYQFRPTTEQFRGSIEDTFNILRTEGKLSDGDVKNRNISLRIYAYEIDAEGFSGVAEEHTIPPQAPGKKRKAANSFSTVSRTREYKSSFRPPIPSPSPEEAVTAGVEYATFDFVMTSMSIDKGGAVTKIVGTDTQRINIAEGWQNDIGPEPKNGYIGKGFMKFVFLGQFQGEKYAIFQSKPDSSTEKQNHDDLLSELSLLKHGQYFAKSFAERAKVKGIRLNAAIRFNAEGAFIGQVDKKDLADWETCHDGMGAPLRFTTFLAAPFLAARDASIYVERKFSGTDETGFNLDIVGAVVDAYAHHVVDDSSGYYHLCDLQGIVDKVGQPKEVILFDPQGNSLSGKTFFGDRGKQAILKFLNEHQCQSLCEKLGLKNGSIPESLHINRSKKLMLF